jgi:hypothetical protein
MVLSISTFIYKRWFDVAAGRMLMVIRVPVLTLIVPIYGVLKMNLVMLERPRPMRAAIDLYYLSRG